MRIQFKVLLRLVDYGPNITEVEYKECPTDGIVGEWFDTEEDALKAIEEYGYSGETYVIVKAYTK